MGMPLEDILVPDGESIYDPGMADSHGIQVGLEPPVRLPLTGSGFGEAIRAAAERLFRSSYGLADGWSVELLKERVEGNTVEDGFGSYDTEVELAVRDAAGELYAEALAYAVDVADGVAVAARLVVG